MVKIEEKIYSQELAVSMVQRFLNREKLPNMIFYGPDGVGKRRLALLTASFITGETLEQIKNGQSTNIIMVVPGDQHGWQDFGYYFDLDRKVDIPDIKKVIKINSIRTLIHDISFFPVKATRRVVIILYADRMTMEAVSALLKTLEEPPEDTIFILTTSRIYRLPGTIISRCQKVKLKVLPDSVILKILKEKNYKEETILPLLPFAEGSVKKIMNMLEEGWDQIIEQSFSLLRKAPLPYEEIMKTYSKLTYSSPQLLLDSFIFLYRVILLYKEGYTDLSDRYGALVRKKADSLMKDDIVKIIKTLLEYRILLDLNPTKKLFIFNLINILI